MPPSPGPFDGAATVRLRDPRTWRLGFFGPLAVAALLETGLVLALVHFAAPAGVIVAPRPHRVRIALVEPKPPAKPKPAPPQPKPPPPKPNPPPPPPKPPPPKPKPPPPPKPPLKPKPPPPKPLPPPPLPKPPPPRLPRPRPKPRHRPHAVHYPRPEPQPVRPSPPSAPPTPPGPTPAEVASIVMQYAAILNAHVQANLQVPGMIEMMHLSGRTVVAIRVAPGGQLLQISVARSSGIAAIDRAALDAVRSTALPPFPGGMPRHPVTFTLTVRLNAS
jgi:protein TonB